MSFVMLKIRRKRGLCPKPGCRGKSTTASADRAYSCYKCSDCGLRYFPEPLNPLNRDHAGPSGLTTLSNRGSPTLNPDKSPAGVIKVRTWLETQNVQMSTTSDDIRSTPPPEDERQREMKELESFKTVHINEMAKSEGDSRTPIAMTPTKTDQTAELRPSSKSSQLCPKVVETSSCGMYGSSYQSSSLTSAQSLSSTISERPVSRSPVNQVLRGIPSPEFLSLTAESTQKTAEIRDVTFEDYAALLASGKLSAIESHLSACKRQNSFKRVRCDIKENIIYLSGSNDALDWSRLTVENFLATDRLTRDIPTITSTVSKQSLSDDEILLHQRSGPCRRRKHACGRRSSGHEWDSKVQAKNDLLSPSSIKVLAPEDEQLSNEWSNKVAAKLQSEIKEVDTGDYVVGLSIADDEKESAPVISIQSEREVPSDQKERLESVVRSLHLPRWNSVAFQYSGGCIRKSATNGASSLDVKICMSSTIGSYLLHESCRCPGAARRRRYSQIPNIGTSIGIAGSKADTATLTAFLEINGKPFILTNDHLFSKSTLTSNYTLEDAENELTLDYEITQPSQQDIHEIDHWIRALTRALIVSTYDDDEIQLREELACLRKRAIEIRKEMRAAAAEQSIYFGRYVHSSGKGRLRKNRDGHEIHMDWAVCSVNPDRLNCNFITTADDGDTCHVDPIPPQDRIPCRSHAPVVPGELVHAVGRTSGYHVGRINHAPYLCNFDGVSTREYGIGNPGGPYAQYWESKGHLGQYGDSGALVVSMVTNKACGMIWGSDEFSIAIFTPLEMVFDDIREKYGAEKIELWTPGSSPRSLSSASSASTVVSVFSDKETARADSDNTSVFSMTPPTGVMTGMKTWDDNILPQNFLPLL